MYELMRAGEQSYYIDCPAKMGVYVRGDGGAYLIDSGSDRDAGKKAKRILDGNGWNLKGILNTHSHADHTGGNRYLQEQTGCRVFAGGMETVFARYPLLEPSFLFGGYPVRELRHKFLVAQESRAERFEGEGFPEEVEVILLPGHAFEMAGFRTPDGTVFAADCVCSRRTLEKYGIPFLYDAAAYLETLHKMELLEAPFFVPSHAECCDAAAFRELVRFNREKFWETAERLLLFCKVPATFERVLQEMFRHYGLEMNFEQYALVGSTVRSLLAWLKEGGKLKAAFADNLLLWETV